MESNISQLEIALAEVVRRQVAQLNSIAIPGFGAFEGIKHDEKVVENPENPGERLLVPPSISVNFIPSVILRKSITNESAH